MKKKYTFVAHATISVHTEVEAETLQDAAKIAADRGFATLYRTDQDNPGEEWCTSGELDAGDPECMEVVELRLETGDDLAGSWLSPITVGDLANGVTP